MTISLDGMERAWHKAWLTLPPGVYGLAFHFVFAGKGEVALANISLADGPCHEKGECLRSHGLIVYLQKNIAFYDSVIHNN